MYLLSGTATSGVWHANLTAGALSCASNAVCTITINASDTLGNYNDTVTTSYYVDDTRPAVTSPSAAPAQVKSASALYIGAVVTDVSNVTSVVSNNSVALTKGAGSWNATTSAGALGCAANAVCTLGFTATDMAGNVNNSVTTAVTVDDTAPVVAFVYNSTNLIGSATAVTLNITVAEANTLASVKANGLTMTQIGATTTWYLTNTGTALGCTSTGSCTVTFVANDTAGNSGSTTTSLNIDNDRPVVSGASVTNATKAKSTVAVNVQVTASDSPAGITSVKANGQTMYLLSGTTYYANLTAGNLGCGAGTCTITINATDSLGNSNASVTASYFVDDTAPTNTSVFSASATSSGATVSAAFGESVKCTVIYGTNASVLGSSATSASFAADGAVAISGLIASTTYYYNVSSCVDEAGNTQSMGYGTFNFTTSAVASGGGGGGGGTVSLSDVGDITGADTQWTLGVGDKVMFGYNGFEHSVRVTKVGPNYAIFQVASDVQEFTLYEGQSRDVDLTEDGKADVTIRMMDVLYNKALVRVTSLVSGKDKIVLLPPAKGEKEDAAPAEQPAAAPETAPSEQPSAAAPSPAAAPILETVEEKDASSWVVALVLAVVVVAVIVAIIFARNKRKAQVM
jgi:hypothetical protein